MDGLIIKEKWLNLILSGEKIWEVRGSACHKEQGTRIGLIQSGTSEIACEMAQKALGMPLDSNYLLCRGQAVFMGCFPLTKEIYEQFRERHCIVLPYEKLPYKKPYVWVLRRAMSYEKPVPVKYPKGAVIWLKNCIEN